MKEEGKKVIRFNPGHNKDILQFALNKESAQDMIYQLEEAIETYSGDFYYNMSGSISIIEPIVEPSE